MSKGKFKFISIVLVSALILLPLVAMAAQKMTAKEGLEKAGTKARAWQADASLIGINASNADKQGKATPHIVATAGLGWTYIFRSDKAQKNLAVMFNDKGDIKTQEDMNLNPA